MAIDSERDMDQDVGFGLRQLSDIAVKAMSPGINDRRGAPPPTSCSSRSSS